MKILQSLGIFLLVLVLAACQEGKPSPTSEAMDSDVSAPVDLTDRLMQNTWQWVSFTSPVEQFDVDAPENYQVRFGADGALNIVADCNLAQGVYTAEENRISIQIGPVTLALCPGDSRSEQFIQLLGGAAIYFFEEGDLFIDLMADGGTFRFEPVP